MSTPIFFDLATVGASPGGDLPTSAPLRRFSIPEPPTELVKMQAAVQRGETVDQTELTNLLLQSYSTLERGITTGTTGFPVRENLDPQVRALLTSATPMRNRIPREQGAGLAAAWKQISSYGGGWGGGYDQLGGGSAAQIFFPETGAPAELASVYANKSAAYKLMGEIGSVTGFAMATGANFQDQYETEKGNSIINLMLNEENSIINADATSVAAPWGDGTNAYSFNGLKNLITTANGTPSANVQTGVGALTFAHIDAQLTRLWNAGGTGNWILINAQEARSIRNLASNASNGLYKIEVTGDRNGTLVGLKVNGYVHPISGEVVEFIVSRFVEPGTMYFGSDNGPLPGLNNAGGSVLAMSVVPQVRLPKLAPNEQVQGFSAQEIAPTKAQPLVYPWIVCVFEVLLMRNATVFAKSTGVTAV